MLHSILITGATSGIGKGLALHYAKSGIHLFLTGRDAERLNEIKKLCEGKGAKVTIAAMDITEK